MRCRGNGVLGTDCWGTGACSSRAVRRELSKSRANIKVEVGYPHRREMGSVGLVTVILGVLKAEASAGGRMWEKLLVSTCVLSR